MIKPGRVYQYGRASLYVCVVSLCYCGGYFVHSITIAVLPAMVIVARESKDLPLMISLPLAVGASISLYVLPLIVCGSLLLLIITITH